MVCSPRPDECVKKIVGRLIEAYADAMDVEIDGLGCWTASREELKTGIEPDECYYVQSLPAIADKERLELSVNPPPDLAIEVDISRSSLPKQPIYAAICVVEIWRSTVSSSESSAEPARALTL